MNSLFLIFHKDDRLPVVELPVTETVTWYSWGNTKRAFDYIHKNYNDYDYVLKVFDDTYVKYKLRFVKFLIFYNFMKFMHKLRYFK